MYFELDSELIDATDAGLKIVSDNENNEDDLNYVISFLQTAFGSLDVEKRGQFIEYCKSFHEFKSDYEKRNPKLFEPDLTPIVLEEHPNQGNLFDAQ